MNNRRRTSANSKRPAASMVNVTSQRVEAATALWRDGRFDDALAVFDEALRTEPDNAQPYFAAARAHGESFDFERMDHLHQRLIARAPHQPGVYHYIGETLGVLKLPARAIASYEQAIELPEAGPLTWTALAACYERANRLDEADELIERARRSGCNDPNAELLCGRILRRRNRLPEAEVVFRAIVESLPEDSEVACQAWSELALMRDGTDDFQGAIDAIERCKKGQKSRQEPFLRGSEKAQQLAKCAINTITQDDLRRWRSAAEPLAPRRMALLIGFPRSGTTLLEQLLDAHADLVSSEERDFIGRRLLHDAMHRQGNTPLLDVLNALSPSDIERGRRQYFQAMEYLLGEPVGGRMHLDKNPACTPFLPVVLRFFPETRLIIALRDPRDVVLSCYLRYLPLNPVSVCFLDIKRTAERYAADMSAWLKLRGLIEVPWCEVRYENIVADFAGESRRALTMLGLPWDDSVLNYRERIAGSKHVNSPSYDVVTQPIFTRAIGRWKSYERWLQPAMATLEPFIREFGYEL